ncbi:MAG TPA: SH3 domain-containing protein, partial [Bdellovibrionota bacterium]|nr:SH3 domain-containing protein [Bdellovibrionota bacterium]
MGSKTRIGLALASLLIALSVSPAAQAARQARVEADSAPLLSGPKADAQVVMTLKKGAALAVSNLPTEGFYKARTETGEVGWIAGDLLALYGSEGGSTLSSPPGGAEPQPAGNPRPYMQGEVAQARGRKTLRIRGFGGFALFNMAQFAQVTGLDALKNGFYAGGELQFILSKKVTMDIRVEGVAKQTIGNDTKNNRTYQFDLSSMPVM